MLADFRFSKTQRAAVERLADVVCPPELATLGIKAEVMLELELMVRAMPTYLRAGLMAGLATFDQGCRAYPPALGKRFANVSDAAVAEAYYLLWDGSPLFVQHQFIKGIKGLLCFSYYEHPKVRESLGIFAEDWIVKVARERMEKYGDEIRSAEEDVLR
jgi:hypothetical protein